MFSWPYHSTFYITCIYFMVKNCEPPVTSTKSQNHSPGFNQASPRLPTPKENKGLVITDFSNLQSVISPYRHGKKSCKNGIIMNYDDYMISYAYCECIIIACINLSRLNTMFTTASGLRRAQGVEGEASLLRAIATCSGSIHWNVAVPSSCSTASCLFISIELETAGLGKDRGSHQF